MCGMRVRFGCHRGAHQVEASDLWVGFVPSIALEAVIPRGAMPPFLRPGSVDALCL